MAERPSKALPTLEDVQAWPESGLGKVMVSATLARALLENIVQLASVWTTCAVHLQDWAVHPGVNLAAYFPFFEQAGVEDVQVRL